MDNGAQQEESSEQSTMNVPKAPNPNNPATDPIDQAYTTKSDEPLHLTTPDWDIWTISALSALRMLQQALEALTLATGDIPPTPPITRPTTPSHPPTTPTTSHPCPLGSPEAHRDEALSNPALEAQAHYIQHAAIARRFFSKTPPPISITAYLARLHTWCPHSPGVYLAAAHYIARLSLASPTLPVTSRTIHRLSLAAIRVASKALEDNKWPQERVAAVGGIGKAQLMNLEVTLCFLLDFELRVGEREAQEGIWRLQQAGRQGSAVKGPLAREVFKMAIPARKRGVVAAAS